MEQKKHCPNCGHSEHLPLTEREVDKENHRTIIVRKWICKGCLTSNDSEMEYMIQEHA